MTYDEAKQHPLWDTFWSGPDAPYRDGDEDTDRSAWHGGNEEALFEQFVRGYECYKESRSEAFARGVAAAENRKKVIDGDVGEEGSIRLDKDQTKQFRRLLGESDSQTLVEQYRSDPENEKLYQQEKAEYEKQCEESKAFTAVAGYGREWWAKPVQDIYLEALQAVGGKMDLLDFGPGHVVWADGNFEDEHVRFCLAQCDERRQEWIEKFGEAVLAVNRLALEKMLAIPEDERGSDPCSDDEEDE